jgi:hypothetical protein
MVMWLCGSKYLDPLIGTLAALVNFGNENVLDILQNRPSACFSYPQTT